MILVIESHQVYTCINYLTTKVKMLVVNAFFVNFATVRTLKDLVCSDVPRNIIGCYLEVSAYFFGIFALAKHFTKEVHRE
jgi:hypothetical protein